MQQICDMNHARIEKGYYTFSQQYQLDQVAEDRNPTQIEFYTEPFSRWKAREEVLLSLQCRCCSVCLPPNIPPSTTKQDSRRQIQTFRCTLTYLVDRFRKCWGGEWEGRSTELTLKYIIGIILTTLNFVL